MLQRRTGSRLLHAVVLALALASGCADVPSETGVAPAGPANQEGAPIRLSGALEAARSQMISVPRLAGQSFNPLVITYLVPAGSRVEAGDLLVVFDRQEQARAAFDRQAEVVDLDGQISKKQSEQSTQAAKDDTELVRARHDVERAELEVRKNPQLARNEAEKNDLALEQATVRLAQLEKTFVLKRQAEEADLEILRIRRVRADQARQHAEENASKMEIHAPFSGLAVIQRMYRSGTGYVEIGEGDEVRPGTSVVGIVDTSVMLVRARINQADALLVRAGQAARIGLDGFPDLMFDGEIDHVAPIGTPGALSEDVRVLEAVIAVHASHPQLLPDLTAFVEIVPTPAAVDAAMQGASR